MAKTNNYRGGNSRLLAKSLDGLGEALAVVDVRGTIVFANEALCRLAGADATELVGKTCSWNLPQDDTPHAAILTALAPPQAALEGRFATRRLTTPVVFGSTATGQVFLPILDQDGLANLTVVVFGNWESIREQLPARPATTDRKTDQLLVQLRSQWQQLNGMDALIGSSPAIELAMRRAQLAIKAASPFLIHGPEAVGKRAVVEAIFENRLSERKIPRHSAQYFPLDGTLMDGDLLDGMLEVFAGRLRPGAEAVAQTLVLENIEYLDENAVMRFQAWYETFKDQIICTATSSINPSELAERSPSWARLISRLSAIEIHIPSLAERIEDIEPLAQQQLAISCTAADRAQLVFARDAIERLVAYPWPGNLEQLKQAIEESVRHAVLSASVQSSHLPVAIRTYSGSVTGKPSQQDDAIILDEILLELEKVLIRKAMRMSPRNRAQVARLLGISRPRLLRRIEQLGLDGKKNAEPEAK